MIYAEHGLWNGLTVRLPQHSHTAVARAVGLLLSAMPAGDIGRHQQCRSTVHSSKCEQCHIDSGRRKLNTDLLLASVGPWYHNSRLKRLKRKVNQNGHRSQDITVRVSVVSNSLFTVTLVRIWVWLVGPYGSWPSGIARPVWPPLSRITDYKYETITAYVHFIFTKTKVSMWLWVEKTSCWLGCWGFMFVASF